MTNINIPDRVTVIDCSVFSGCGRLSSVKIPASVIEIEGLAFFKSGLKKIIIPDSVQQIGKNAFGECNSLEMVVLPSQHIDIQEHVNFDDGCWEAAFESCKRLTEVINGEVYKESCFYHTPYAEQRMQQSNAGCYIATAVYGSYDCSPVWTLRRYRDFILAKHWYGCIFIRTYYAVSPSLVKYFGHTVWFKRLWKTVLDCMVLKLNAYGIEDTPYKDTCW